MENHQFPMKETVIDIPEDVSYDGGFIYDQDHDNVMDSFYFDSDEDIDWISLLKERNKIGSNQKHKLDPIVLDSTDDLNEWTTTESSISSTCISKAADDYSIDSLELTPCPNLQYVSKEDYSKCIDENQNKEENDPIIEKPISPILKEFETSVTIKNVDRTSMNSYEANNVYLKTNFEGQYDINPHSLSLISSLNDYGSCGNSLIDDPETVKEIEFSLCSETTAHSQKLDNTLEKNFTEISDSNNNVAHTESESKQYVPLSTAFKTVHFEECDGSSASVSDQYRKYKGGPGVITLICIIYM